MCPVDPAINSSASRLAVVTRDMVANRRTIVDSTVPGYTGVCYHTILYFAMPYYAVVHCTLIPHCHHTVPYQTTVRYYTLLLQLD